MAREKNGWVKLYTSILKKKWSLAEFKVFVGLLLLANSQKHTNPGLVDLPLREIAKRLHISIGALIEARDKFIREDRIKTIKIPTKTKPIMAIKIINFPIYQGKKFVSSSEQSKEECSPSETKNVHPVIQNVHPVEQTVSPSEQSRIQNRPPKNTENNKESIEKIKITNKLPPRQDQEVLKRLARDPLTRVYRDIDKDTDLIPLEKLLKRTKK